MSAFSGFSGLKAPTEAVKSGATPFKVFTLKSNPITMSTSDTSIVQSQDANGK